MVVRYPSCLILGPPFPVPRPLLPGGQRRLCIVAVPQAGENRRPRGVSVRSCQKIKCMNTGSILAPPCSRLFFPPTVANISDALDHGLNRLSTKALWRIKTALRLPHFPSKLMGLSHRPLPPVLRVFRLSAVKSRSLTADRRLLRSSLRHGCRNPRCWRTSASGLSHGCRNPDAAWSKQSGYSVSF